MYCILCLCCLHHVCIMYLLGKVYMKCTYPVQCKQYIQIDIYVYSCFKHTYQYVTNIQTFFARSIFSCDYTECAIKLCIHYGKITSHTTHVFLYCLDIVYTVTYVLHRKGNSIYSRSLSYVICCSVCMQYTNVTQ